MAIQIPPSAYARSSLNSSSPAARTEAPAADNSAVGKVAGIVRSEPQSAEKTAANILNFVQRGLQQLQAQGGDSERLQQRLDAAREGIEKGYRQAQDMLDGMGMLDDELKSQIAAGRELVDAGLDALAEDPSAELFAPAEQAVSSSAQLSVSNQMSLQVVTRDGDRVRVSFAQSSSAQASVGDNRLSLRSSAELGFQMSVEGQLSDEERSALDTLFADVYSLSEQFFAGDLGGALEQAMSLGFDGQQLASMSLDLRQQASVARQAFYPAQKPELPEPLQAVQAPLAAYSEAYEQALQRANPLAEPQQSLRDMMSALLPEESRMPIWQSFSDGLDQALAQRDLASDALS
ncbi:hypothetical protein CHH28_18360 [Bacterioplanes sanyensis]|uniref:DUF5610 domain-containing protein n=1 Tax=Bacterioplanes sanyensis TaxID=1249553 RepID=A0A222FQ34_9GAMM|nr:DUF5610 domain-containing protein [Bacterioplanes sanyensis]ASP40511.1 hypothetical protein CHH28_18360 [Bacterioplanes sanyensis]